MIYKIWKSLDKIYCIEADSLDDAFATVQEINPVVNSGQVCEDSEIEILRYALNELSLKRPRIIPTEILRGHLVVG